MVPVVIIGEVLLSEWVVAGDGANSATTHKAAPQKENYPVPDVNCAVDEQPWSRESRGQHLRTLVSEPFKPGICVLLCESPPPPSCVSSCVKLGRKCPSRVVLRGG